MAKRETEYEDIEDIDEDQMPGDLDQDMEDMDDMGMPSLFWNVQLKPDGETDLEPPAIDGFVIHITKACFGANVKAGSRTVVVTKDDDNKEVPICVLLEGKNECVSLDLIISDGLTFQLKGKNVSPVSLTGYISPPPNMLDHDDEGALSMDDEEMGGEIEDEDELPASLREQVRKRKLEQAQKQNQDDDNEAPELQDESKEDIEPPSKRAKTENNNNKNKQPQQQKQNPNQNKQQQQQQNNTTTTTTTTTTIAAVNGNEAEKPLSKNQKKKQKQQAKKAAQENPGTTTTTTTTNNTTNNHEEKNDEVKEDKKSPKNIPNPSPKETSNNNNKEGGLMKMKNGLQYKDLKNGDGPAVKPGQKLTVYYVGQLSSNKEIFDKNINGEGFSFTLGQGQVIKGWDEGLKGMKVGGKRRIIVPSNLGYGKEGSSPKIPPNAELTFTVEVKKAE